MPAPATTGFACNCADVEERFLHDPRCDVWLDDDFFAGEAAWNPSTGEIELLRDEIIDDRTEEERRTLVWAAADYQAGVEGAGETRSREAEVFEKPEDMPVECICTVKAKLYCWNCGVDLPKGATEWVRTKTRQDREAKEWPLVCKCNPEEQWECTKCKVQRWYSDDQWRYWNPPANAAMWSKCRHYHEAVVMPDGTTVYASSMTAHKEGKTPDFGVYAATGWRPDCIAFTVNWDDYGLPQIPYDQLEWALDYALASAREGKKVEFGCVGGHGRTGSMLALVALKCGAESAKVAIDWIRSNYCKETIEGIEQEWFVAYWEARLKGTEPPPKPEKKSWVSTPAKGGGSGVTTIAKSVATKVMDFVGGLSGPDEWAEGGPMTEEEEEVAYGNGAHSKLGHWVMFEKGDICTDCKWGEMDAIEFFNGEIPAGVVQSGDVVEGGG